MATNVLPHAKIDPEFSLGYSLHTAMTRHGKSPWSQVREIWRLRWGPGRLRPDEYYYYGLYDDRRFSFADKTHFVGRSIQDQIIRQCNIAEWWFIAHDKLVCYGLLAGLGLPVPQTRALYQAEGRFAAVPAFTEPAALAAHLRSGMRYPFFGKPVAGIRSIGVAVVERYDAGGDTLVFMGGRTLALDGFVTELEVYRKQGYLFQEMLRPHPEIATLCGPRVSTVRLIVLLEDGEPALSTPCGRFRSAPTRRTISGAPATCSQPLTPRTVGSPASSRALAPISSSWTAIRIPSSRSLAPCCPIGRR
jgi:hypothetical protein